MTELPRLHRAPLPAGRPALVSICIPTLNRARYIDDTLRAALDQSYEPLEVVVVDDASKDDTAVRVRAYNDPRIRLYVNRRTLGMGRNANRALELARGQLIKFLDSDDLLDRDCVAKMVKPFVEAATVGLVFARRRLLVDSSGQTPSARTAEMRELHTHFGSLQPLNDGRRMLSELLCGRLRGNWIGEPSSVMVRRAHLEVSGGFAHYVQHTTDLDLWVRLLPHSLVGFVDEELVSYRWAHPGSESARLGRTRRGWIDRLWTLEALARDSEVARAYPQVDDLLRDERRQAYRTAMRGGSVPGDGRVPVRPYLRYLRYRTLSRLGRAPELFAVLPHAA